MKKFHPFELGDIKTKSESARVNQDDSQGKQEPTTIIAKVFKCSICSASGIRERNLLLHHTSNHGDTPFELKSFVFAGVTLEVKCQYCNRQVRKSIFAKHMSSFHHEVALDPVQLFKCTICGTDDMKIYDLNEHHLVYHNEIPVTENIFQIKVEPSTIREDELTSKEIVESISEEKSPQIKKETASLKQYQCKICGAGGLEKIQIGSPPFNGIQQCSNEHKHI